MNAMRRFLLGSSGGSSNSSSNQNSASNSSHTTAPVGPPSSAPADSHINLGIKPSPSQHAALSLTHLKKLFTDFQKSCHTLTEAEREARLYSMVPLFCRVFATASAAEMYEKFPELVAFCHHVSKLLVSEVRRRALDESTETASFAIAKFLEIENCEETSNGWMLLTALNLLTCAGHHVIEEMTSAAIPSTLVKCLYLFFDLPPLQEADVNDPDSEFSPRERRILLQKIILQLLVKLCNYSGPAEELARQDDLTLLFSAISSWCPPWNILWRKSAAETLVTLSRHGLTGPVLSYIHKKGCIGLCVENMQRARDLTPLELMEMFVTVFCLLKDSSELVSTLLDDFRSSQGYVFLAEFLLKTEQDIAGEAQEATRNLVLLLSSLCMCGFNELRPTAAASGTVFQMPGFCVPYPQGAGSSVRNLQAFQVLQSVFIKSASPFLCGAILDAISSIYHSDNANYFILEGQNTLAQFAEKIHTKAPEIQEKFFKLLEFVVFQLNYVPCKELIALSLLLRNHGSVSCSIYCMMTLLAVLRHNPIYKDVYREVGLLEVFVICLIRFASLLKEKEQDLQEESKNSPIPELEDKLGFLVMDALGVLLAGCPDNAAIFRESGGARCAHNMVPYAHCRREALGLVQQLVLSTGGDDDLGTLLGMMHAAPPTALTLKADMLKSLLSCLRESHRARTVFRKISGFVYVVSILVGLEGALSENPALQWTTVPRQQLWSLIHLVLNTLTVAMRYEPANAKFFQTEINDSLRYAIRLLGCFGQAKKLTKVPSVAQEETFRVIFTEGLQEFEYRSHLPASLQNVSLLLRFLYDMALDVYENKVYQPIIASGSPLREPKLATQVKKVSTLNLNAPMPELNVVHPGVILSVFQLLPAIEHAERPEMATSVQVLLMDIIRNVLRSERNQELLCDAGLPAELLNVGRVALEDESHPLHSALQYAWERLASQALEPKDLREFLRLGNPLNCVTPDSPQFPPPPLPVGYGGPVPLSRVKTLVSMATPRDLCLQGTAALALPPFVEFDMSPEGFGCLLLPSLAPQYPGGPAVVGMGALGGAGDISVIGGIGQGDRVFPPQTGLTYSTWLCVDRFSDPRSDPHCLRLLTIVRQVRDDHLVCLSVALSARDKALIVSTQEMSLPKGTSDWEPELNGDFGVRIWSPDLIQEGQWHHIALVFNRAVLKNSQFSLYVDGQHTKTCKLHYMSQNPGGGSANLTIASSVYAYIGTSPDWRRRSRLCWRQGPCHLLEEVLSPQAVLLIYRLGPHYLGSLQAPQPPWSYEPLGPLLPEEKVLFGLNAVAMSTLTLSKIRKVYSKADNKQIAKQLGMSTHENATPLCILHNGAGHLNGPARTLGGVAIGYLGVRVFCPKPVSTSLQCVGGCAVLLGLVSMSRDVESLYAAVKALVCVVRANVLAQREMERSHGYQTLAFLLRHHRPLLNNHILHLILSLVGTVDSGRENMAVPANVTAFRDLLADLDVWKETPGDLLKTLLEHLHELCTESSEQKSNVRALRELHLVPRLLSALRDRAKLSANAKVALLNLLGVLLAQQPRSVDLLCLGQFLASTLPPVNVSEGNVNLEQDNAVNSEAVQAILTRNDGLELILQLLQHSKAANSSFGEELVRVLGFDWLLLFLQGHIHPTSATCSLRMLVCLLCSPTLLLRFKEGAPGCMGGWLRPTELVPQGHRGILLGFQLAAVSNPAGVSSQNVKREENTNCYPGFQVLQQLLPAHCQNNSVYFLLMALLWAQPLQKLPQTDTILDLDNVWACLTLGTQPVTRNVSCTEAITTVLHMVKVLLHQEIKKPEETPQWLKNHPVTLVQFLFYVYQNCADSSVHFMNPEVLGALVAPLFPPELLSECSSPLDDTTHTPWEPVMLPSTTTKDQALLLHPATKFILDFLRVLVVDALALAPNTKSVPIIDLVLEAGPDTASHDQLAHYQTEILSALMEHLLAADVFLAEVTHQSTAQTQAQQQQFIAANVFYVAGRLVDKLWQGYCLKHPQEVLDFLIKLLTQAKRRSTALVSLENLYRCLNRTILYLLSRPMESVPDQMGVLETLHKLTHNRSLIFGAGNHDLEFLGGLTYCLVHLAAGVRIVINSNNKTTWHVNPDSNTNANTATADASWQQGQNLVALAAKRVWEELYISKKPAIEEVFKTSLGTNKAPSLEVVKDQLRDAATRVWLAYVDGEKRCVYRAAYESQNQITSKIQKVTGGLTRLASRTKARREETLNKNKLLTFLNLNELTQLTQSQLVGIREMVDSQWRQFALAQLHAHQYLRDEWKVTERELLRERGVWGPLQGSSLDKWMLDMTEGPSRMRKKLVRNFAFYAHYPYRPELELNENRQLKYKVATSLDSKEFHRLFAQWKPNLGVACADEVSDAPPADSQQALIPANASQTQTDSAKVVEDALRDLRTFAQFAPALKPGVERSISELEDDNDTELGESDEKPNKDSAERKISAQPSCAEESPAHQTLLRYLEEGERITHMFRCARVQGLDTAEGLLLFGREHLYVVDGFTLLRSREIKEISSLSPEQYDPIIPPCTTPGAATSPTHPVPTASRRHCSQFSYEDIREVHKRRYLLQPIALEVFSQDGRNHLLAFPRGIRHKVYQRLLATATSLADSAQLSVAGQRRSAHVETSGGLFSSLMGETSVTQRWVRGEISNFQYLMHLNTLAGRSYNDLMQYPVFPWILADYDSPELDLSSPATFRDLSKPMGAQTPGRLVQFQKRYKEWDDPHSDTPPYHYGTHYSSAMIVCSYLVRLEPFAQHFLHLQGGHFDLADRMFHSVREAWYSAAKHNMADVKELIPEFFYLPEFLMNANKFDLGVKQSGVALHDILLPPWAKDDPREFIRMHRMALECDYVSQHLHEWIDLIFGCKQQGPMAVEAVNVFHHLFYEGNVDIYAIQDPLQKTATIGFINNFGQIPKQLFKKAHPAKKARDYALYADKLFFHHLDHLKPSLTPVRELKRPVGHMICAERNALLAVEENKVLLPPNHTRALAWGFADHSLRLVNYDSDKAVLVCEAPHQGEILAAVAPFPKMVLTGGTSTVVTVWEVGKKTLTWKQQLFGHREAVTCLCASPAYGLAVSGSRDRTAIVWDLSTMTFLRELPGHSAALTAVAINSLTGDIATCAGTWLHLWSINGTSLACVNTLVGQGRRSDRLHHILCVEFSVLNEWDAANIVVTGATDGVVRMWSLDYVQIPDQDVSIENDNEKGVAAVGGLVTRNSESEAVAVLNLSESLEVEKLEESESSAEEDDEPEGEEELAEKLDPENSFNVSEDQDKVEKSPLEKPPLVRQNSLTSSVDLEDPAPPKPPLRRKRIGGDRRALCKSEFFPAEASIAISEEGEKNTLRSSKSDTSINDSFVVISDSEANQASETNPTSTQLRSTGTAAERLALKEGFHWQRQIIFRSKLTMHTAYDREDNAEPASVTAIAIAKDHRTLYIGDARGRIFSWSVTDQPGRGVADHWLREDWVEACLACQTKFTLTERRHHCRNCGHVFCSRCSSYESEIARLRIVKPVRVCHSCYTHLRSQAVPT